MDTTNGVWPTSTVSTARSENIREMLWPCRLRPTLWRIGACRPTAPRYRSGTRRPQRPTGGARRPNQHWKSLPDRRDGQPPGTRGGGRAAGFLYGPSRYFAIVINLDVPPGGPTCPPREWSPAIGNRGIGRAPGRTHVPVRYDARPRRKSASHSSGSAEHDRQPHHNR